MPKDLYSILEVPRQATQQEIRKAFITMSRKYHPDKAPPELREEFEARFKDINQANEVLSNEQSRSFYDQTGELPGEGGRGGGGMPPGFSMGGGGFPFDIGGLFGMFGGGRGGMPPGMMRGRRPGKAPARHTHIPLTLRDFYYGRTLQIHLERQRFCTTCKGEGALHVSACDSCGGSGVKTQMLQIGPGMMMNASGPCMPCQGSGKTKGDSCGACKGAKFIKQDKTLDLIITKGMKYGDCITFSGESSHVEDWQEPGDVIVELVEADEESNWKRNSDDLETRVKLTLGESLCGTTMKLDGHPGYPDGLFVSIPAGVVNRQTILVEGCGMPRSIGSGFGDAVLLLTIAPTPDEKKYIESQKDTLRSLFHVDSTLLVPPTATQFTGKPLSY